MSRLDAAAKAGIAEWDRVEPRNPVSASFVASHVDSIKAALAAGDAVMFSDEAIERAARKMINEGHFKILPEAIMAIRAVVHTLKDVQS